MKKITWLTLCYLGILTIIGGIFFAILEPQSNTGRTLIIMGIIMSLPYGLPKFFQILFRHQRQSPFSPPSMNFPRKNHDK